MDHQETCPYCRGEGYFQLLLGGTENCPNCQGLGLIPAEQIEIAATAKS